MRDVDHMHQQVGFAHLVERRFERLDQLGGQFADESHGIGQQEREVVENHLAHRRVECCKEFVLGKHLAFGDQVHQRGLAHVGIAYQRHTHHRTAVRALHGHLTVDFLQILLEFGDPVTDDTAVGLDLALTGTAAGTGTAALPFEVSPHARKAGQHIFVVGQLHLRLGIGRLRPRHENIEDQARTVEDAAGHGLFDIARLRRGELVVENHHVDLLLPAVTGDLFQLARADVYAGRRLRQPLRKAFHTHDIGRFGQEFEFVEELFGLPRILVVADNGDHHGALSAIGNGLGVRGYILILSQSRTLNFKQSHRAATCGREGAPCGEQTLCYKKGILLSADTLFIKLSCRTFSTQTTYVRSVLYAEIDRERVFDTHSLVTLLAGAPFRRLVQHADGFFGKRPVGRLQHLDIGQATVLVNYKRKNDTALNPVLKGNLRELDILLNPRPERIEVSILERWHRLGSNENRVVREILVLGRRHNFDNRIRIELLEGEIRLHEPVIGNDFDQLGKSLYLDLLGFLFGRVGRDRDNIDIDGHNIHCDFLDPVLVRRIGKCDNDQGQCHDQTNLQ